MSDQKATVRDIKAAHRIYLRKRLKFYAVLAIALLWIATLTWMLASVG